MSMDEVLKELQGEYIKSLPEKIRHIEKMYKSGKYPEVQDAFHKIKGSGMTYSVPELSAIGATLESICLSYPKEMGWAVQKALYLMQQVYTYRLAGRAYAPEKNEEFQKMLGIIETSAKAA